MINNLFNKYLLSTPCVLEDRDIEYGFSQRACSIEGEFSTGSAGTRDSTRLTMEQVDYGTQTRDI